MNHVGTSGDTPLDSAYREVIRFLYSLQWFGVKLGLDNVVKLAALAGNPHHRLRFIHVAGTNGKGSTCAMLESIYRAAGFRVGLYTSPHLVSFRERIQVNRVPISKSDVVRLGFRLRELLRQFPAEAHPTFFEVTTVMALQYFCEQGCDLVIWETGMGGRLDATNIVTPLASVITPVHFDHQQWLGYTLREIAAEKAGIIKPGVPVITCPQPEDVMHVIRTVAAKCACPLKIADPGMMNETEFDGVALPLPGRHQRQNAALAIATVRTLADSVPVQIQAIVRGLNTVSWPGRCQIVRRPDGQMLIIDGAHNISGITVLASALQDLFPAAKPAVILGMLRDKDYRAVCRVISTFAGAVACVPVHSPRAAAPDELAAALRDAGAGAKVTTCGSLADALVHFRSEPVVVVTGSLFLVGEALRLLKVEGLPEPDELDLNSYRVTSQDGPYKDGARCRT